jgi:replicative DNA helicase
MTPQFVVASDLVGGWRDDLMSGRSPVLFPVAESGPLTQIEIGPGMVTLLGGAPGSGKTAFIMQLVLDALRLTPNLKALVANVEMSPTALLDRQLARLSGIDLSTVRHRRLEPNHKARVAAGMEAIGAVAGRLAFARMPYTVENVAFSADAVGADLVVLDYVQRFSQAGGHSDRKTAVDGVMAAVRGFAEAGVAVIVVAAVGRQRDGQGKAGYTDLNLASFRESSELEYGADDAYILSRNDPDAPAAARLSHVKSRHGEPQDITLHFNGAVQRFDAVPAPPVAGRLSAAVQDVWDRMPEHTHAGGDW